MSKFESILLHEVGHSLGNFHHANTSTNGNKAAYETEIANNADFMNLEYGNKYELMGKREYSLAMNGGMKDVAGMLDSSRIYTKNWWGITTVTVNTKYDLQGKNYIEVLILDQRNFDGKHFGYGLEVREAIENDTMLTLNYFEEFINGLKRVEDI